MQGVVNMHKEVQLNETSISLLKDIFKEPEQFEKAKVLYTNIINDRAGSSEMKIEDLKREAIMEIQDTLLTKDLFYSEIGSLKKEMHYLNDNLRKETDSLIKGLELRLIKWMLGVAAGTVLTTVGAIFALLKSLLNLN